MPEPLFSRRGRVAAALVAAAAALSVVSPPAAAAQQQQAPDPQQPLPTPPPAPVAPSRPTDANTLPSPLNLAQAIEFALRLQPNVAVSAANRQASEERLRVVNTGYLPFVTPQYTYSSNYNFGRTRSGIGGGVTPVNQGTSNTTRQGDVALSYRLFDTGTRDLNARQARQSFRGALFSEENTRQSVIASVADAYFEALRNNALVTVSESQVTRAQQTLDVVRAQVEAGVSPRKDIFQAEADLANAQVALLRAQNNAQTASAQLKNTIGVVGGERLRLADVPAPTAGTPTTATLSEAAAGPSAAGTGDIDAAIGQFSELAFRTRPDVAQGQTGVEVNRTGIGLARINSGLTVASDVAAGYQFQPSTGNNRQISLQLSYPLFDAGASRAQLRSAQADVRASEAQLASLRQQIAVEVEQAVRTLATARASIPAAQAAQRAAQVNYEAAVESRREGVGTIVEVITAQTQLVQAQTNYVQTVYDFYQADARLARAVGQAGRIAEASPAVTQNGPTLGQATAAAALTAPKE